MAVKVVGAAGLNDEASIWTSAADKAFWYSRTSSMAPLEILIDGLRAPNPKVARSVGVLGRTRGEPAGRRRHKACDLLAVPSCTRASWCQPVVTSPPVMLVGPPATH